MKNLLSLSFGIGFMLFTSCSDELEMNTYTEDLQKEKITTVQDASSPLTSCDFSLETIGANETIEISCLIDLEGKTVNLNSNVQLVYGGGDIINGTLAFNDGKIDGRFLNKSLSIEGEAKLIDPSFTFSTPRWDIVEGRTNYEKALNNRLHLEDVMKLVKRLGGTTLNIDNLDAYFEVTEVTHPTNPNFYPSVEAINVPGDFNLVMSNNTHLRVFPNSSKKSSLLAIRNVSNATIKGGNLYGDRDEHEYVGYSSHEWGHLIDLHSAKFARVEGVKVKNATGDGLVVHSLGFSFKPDYIPSHDIVITDCVFDSSRRNNLAITDGYNIIVENSEFLNSGVDTEKSKGTNPKFAIDIEAYRKRENGKLVLYEKVENVILRNNIERGGARGGFLIAVGDNITIENNDVESGIGYKYTNNSVIKNNRIVDLGRGGVAMGIGMKDSRTISNNKVINNHIEGYDVAMSIYGDDHLIENNTIKNCGTAINGKEISNTKILNNRIVSNDPKSRGIFIHYTSINRVLFKKNYIDVPNNPFKFSLVNRGSDETKFCAHLVDNEFNSSAIGLLTNTNGISLMKNKVNTGVQIWDSQNSIIENNDIKSNTDGIYLVRKNEDISLLHNSIDVPAGKQCVRIQTSTNREDVEEVNNICMN